MEYTGPRRGRQIDLDDGRRVVEWQDGRTLVMPPPTAATGAAATPAAAKKAQESIKLALHSVNLFVRPVTISDEATVAVQRKKTWIYVPTLTITALVIIVYSLLQPTTKRLEMLFPTYDQYMVLVEPSCSCAVAPRLGQCNDQGECVAQFNYPDYGNATVNACGMLLRVYEECMAGAANATVSPCAATDAGAAFLVGFLQNMVPACGAVQQAQDSLMANVRYTSTGSTLLTSYDLQALLNQTAVDELQKLGLAGSSSLITLEMITGLGLPSVLELTDGSDPLARSPQNCTCAAQRDNPMHLRDLQGNWCWFAIAFDWKAAQRPAGWTCFSAPAVLSFPLDLVDVPLFKMLGLPPGPDNYTRFNYTQGDVPLIYWAVLESFYPACFESPVTLKSGIFTSNHRAYFDVCEPQSCSYTITSTPSFLTGLTTALGTISGLQAVFLLLVDRGYDWYRLKCERRKPQPAAASVSHEGEAGTHDVTHSSAAGDTTLRQPLVATAHVADTRGPIV